MSHFWSSEQLFFDGDEYFDHLIKDIRSAVLYISVEMYMFNDDKLGKKIVAELILAQKRGVKVQIIVDGVGSLSFFNKLHGIFSKEGILVKVYNPLPLYHPFHGKLSIWKKLKALTVRFLRLNKRNHRKIITIDHHIMYAGSFNITAEHTRYHLKTAWKDIGVKVTGIYVKFAVLNFKKIWKRRDYSRFKKQAKKSIPLNWRRSPLRLNQTLFMKGYFYRNLLTKVKEAESKIWLMTPYFIPRRRFIRLLGKAASNGVDVRLLISQKTDVSFFHWLQFFYYAYLLKKGVKIYQYTDTILHAKNFIIDDYMTIGSTNLNHRSFLHDLEFDLVIQEGENKKKIEEHFLASTIAQKTITLEDLKQRPFLDRALSRLFFLFKYWF